MRKTKKFILAATILGATMQCLTISAYAGTWYSPGKEYVFYMGKPGNPGEQVTAEVDGWQKNDPYRYQVNGQWISNSWIGHVYPGTTYIDWSYCGSNGKELGGWQQLDGQWYDFSSGCMSTGWHRIDGNYYYFDLVTGVMQTSGTAVRDGVTYEFSANGLSQKLDGLKSAGETGADGWKQEAGKWYYIRVGEKVKSEWLNDGNTKYYVGSDGVMYTGMHVIDGYYYHFLGTGALEQGAGSTYSKGKKIVFEQGGRGSEAAMNAEERLNYSAATFWCNRTYEIYERAVKMMYWERGDEENIKAGLKSEWAITSKEECRATITSLFEKGKAESDKSEKAWDFSRAMMLCEIGYWADWWDFAAQMDMQIAMAPTIQQSFSSWDEFNNSYMDGFARWSGTAGESYAKRKTAYDNIQNFGISYDIDWNEKLEKNW